MKIVYLMTAVASCYVSGMVLVAAVYYAESKLESLAGSMDSALIGFVAQNILVVFLYMFVAWWVSRFFRKVMADEPSQGVI
ncbi:MAG: hypothetical protein H8E41_13305 [Desulfobulbaceae bacterium]|uniref:Uncharacterized protein n=1 Tax=Candidatus Desulfobia pelagia TaxID=2841692 RepID=A0A8J6TD57_9BACT|nr:hypothetical protein [Candidatus Desulfobia pelagia]